MNVITELKSRLSAYLEQENGNGLREFREWFADILRTANGFDEPTQKLIWSVDYFFASFGSGGISRSALRSALRGIVGLSAPVKAPTVYTWTKTSGTNDALASSHIEKAIGSNGKKPTGTQAYPCGNTGSYTLFQVPFSGSIPVSYSPVQTQHRNQIH